MQRPDPETLQFLGPGLVHQFANVLFTIQGSAQLLNGEGEGAARAAIGGATARGGASLEMLRFLVGEPAQAPAAVATVLEHLADLVRVPLREAGRGFVLRASPARPGPLVDASDVVVLTATALRALTGLVPTGVAGTMVLAWEPVATGPDVVVTVAFEPAAGTLPFPVPIDELQQMVAVQAMRRAGRVACAAHAAGVTLHFPVIS